MNVYIYYKGCNLLWQPLKYEIYDSVNRVAKQNTSGQRGNKFNTSNRDISVIVAENNSVVEPKY